MPADIPLDFGGEEAISERSTMVLTIILLCSIVIAAIIWRRFFTDSLVIKALLSAQALVALIAVILTFGGDLIERWQPTFDVSVQRALWFQYVTDKLADNGERVIHQEWIDEHGIYSYIFLELLVENRKEYVSTIADIVIDKIELQDYERLHVWTKWDPRFNFRWVDSLGYEKHFTLPDEKARFFWDLDWEGDIDLSVFQPKERRPIYIILQFKTHAILQGELTGQFHLIDMGMKKIEKEFDTLQGRNGKAREFVER